MERTARGRYETHLDDPEFTVMEDGTRFAGFFLGDGEDDPAVFPMEVTAGYAVPHPSRADDSLPREWFHRHLRAVTW